MYCIITLKNKDMGENMKYYGKSIASFFLVIVMMNSFQMLVSASNFSNFYNIRSIEDLSPDMNEMLEESITLPEEEEFVLPGAYEVLDIDAIPTDNLIMRRSAEAGRWIWPTAEFYPVICQYLCYENHHAIDIYAETGTPIYAARDGVVVQMISTCPNMSANQKECGGGYGNYITLKHSNGVYSRYAHLDSVNVKMGQTVAAGQKIGAIGTSGRVGAAHLHFEIRPNTQGMKAGGWDPLDSTRFSYVLPSEANSSKVGWVKESNQWYYYKGGAKQTGWQKIDGTWYYLNANGVMQTGWLRDQGTWYYLNASGAMMTGWQKIDGTWYYMDASGGMKTGWLKDQGTWYYLNASGAMQTGWLKDQGTWYYLKSSGAMAIGWEKVNGTWYYLNASGAMQTGWLKDQGRWYYLNASGAMQTGWLKDQGRWYYLNASGVMQTGWQKINRTWYYFYTSGEMAANTEIDGWKIDADGGATPIEGNKNGWAQLGNDKIYYIDGVIQTGLVTIDGAKYYFNQDGKMQTGWQKINGVNYYFYTSGEMATNIEIDGWKIDANGVATKIEVILNGWQKVDNDWYYYVDNIKQTGWLKDQGMWYYLKPDGKMMSNDWLTENGKKYYFAQNGAMKTGWIEWRHQWYYANSSGEMLTSGTIDGWLITPSGMAYRQGQMNPDYVVNKSIERLLTLDGFIYNPDLDSSNATHTTINGQPNYDEALTEAIVVEVLTSGKTNFNVYLDGNTAHIFVK